MFMRLIYLKNSTFLSLKITVDTLIDVGNETSKDHFLKSVKINKLTLSVLIQLLQFSRQRPSFSAQRAALMTKTDLTCPVFSLRFVDFAVQFCFRRKCSLHEKRLSSQV